VRRNLHHILGNRTRLALILAGDHLYRMNYKSFIRRHDEAHADITAALNQAVRWGLIVVNPAGRVDPPKIPATTVTVPTDEQVRTLIAGAPDDMGVWLRVAATTGHRVGTLAALRWSAIDFDDGSVIFSRAITRSPEGLVEKSTKADRADRVSLDRYTVEALRAHRTRMAERALSAGVALTDDAYVWSADPACRLPRDPSSVSHWFTDHRRSLDLPDGITLHTLRHYAASKMLSAGIGSAVVADRLGATARVIESTYRHHMPGQDQAAAELMGEALGH
jgi:integrase